MSDADDRSNFNYTSGANKISDADYRQQLNNWQDKIDLSGPSQAKDWYGNEYEKHIQGVRDRYPMLSQLLLRGKGLDNANLSDIGTTNKYARLADAYNAQMRYVPSDITVSGIGKEGLSVGKGGNFETVPQLKTQDQAQMDLLREGQKKLQQYELNEESFFQRDLETRKMDEMKKLVDREYQQQWFNSDEQKRRIAELFTSWRTMNEFEFNQVTTMLKIPREKARELKKMLEEGRYIDAAILTEGYGLTPMTADQIFMFQASSPYVKQMMTGDFDPASMAKSLGTLKGHQIIEQFAGIVEAGRNSTEPIVRDLTATLETALKEVQGIADVAAKNLKLITIIGIVTQILDYLMGKGLQGVAIAKTVAGLGT
jgi:hypothetical protein